MAVNCDPNALEAAAVCFKCLSPTTHMEVQTYLLAVIAGGSTDPNTLQKQAAAFQSLSPATLSQIRAYLLCQIANEV